MARRALKRAIIMTSHSGLPSSPVLCAGFWHGTRVALRVTVCDVVTWCGRQMQTSSWPTVTAGGGNSGSTRAHCSSVRSDGYAGLPIRSFHHRRDRSFLSQPPAATERLT